MGKRNSTTWRRLALLCLASLSTHCATPSAPTQAPATQDVLVVIAADDPAGSFDGLEGTLRQNFAQLPGIRGHFRRALDLEGWRALVLDTSPADGPWDALVMAFHGKPNKLQFASGGSLHQRNVSQISQGLQHAIAPDAPVILYSCLTGSGADNLAADFATALDRPVIAPSYYWLMQAALPLAQRTPELGLDKQRRLTVQASHFALFYKSRLESGRDRYLIAPRAMTTLCLQDGFELRGSRSRPLFHRHSPHGLKRSLP